jgi:transcriptional regulator with XRE-family HTH domain
MSHRNEQRWKSTFACFVRAYGVARLAKGLGIDPSAIYHWLRGLNSPRPEHAGIIQRLAHESGVELTFDHIYRHFLDLQASDPEWGTTPSVSRPAAASNAPTALTVSGPGAISVPPQSETRLHLVPPAPRSPGVSRVTPSIESADAPAVRRKAKAKPRLLSVREQQKRSRLQLLRSRVREMTLS